MKKYIYVLIIGILLTTHSFYTLDQETSQAPLNALIQKEITLKKNIHEFLEKIQQGSKELNKKHRELLKARIAKLKALTQKINALIRKAIYTAFTTNPVLWFNSKNFRVIDGQVYRSAQPTLESMTYFIEKYGIKSVLNLRNPYQDEKETEWFKEEKKIARENDVSLVTIPLDGSKLPTQEQIEQLLDFLEYQDRPFLIHCRAGADRTGLVGALYMLEIKYGSKGEKIKDNNALNDALNQLRFSYGHFALLHPSMKKFIREWYALRKEYSRVDALEEYDPANYKTGWDISDALTFLKPGK